MKKTNNKTTLHIIFLVFILLTLLCLFGAITTITDANAGLSVLFFVLTLMFGFSGTVTLIMFIAYYNSLVKNKNKIEESLSLIDVYLKMRFDLVPNLVNTVKGYMEHEKEVLHEITLLRSQAKKAQNEEERIALSNELAMQMKNIFIAVENYPELKASKLFLNLTEQLRDVENKIAASRRFYNANINVYNNKVQTFPSSIIANSYGFKTEKMFQIDINEKVLPSVSLTE